jgi:hypothetical protein
VEGRRREGVFLIFIEPPFLPAFILNKMCDIIKSGVRTKKEFK